MGRRKQIVRDILELGNYHVRQEGNLLIVQKKRGVSTNRFKKDDLFFDSRLRSTEFGNASEAGKLLREALSPLLKDINCKGLTAHVTQLMLQVKELDDAPKGSKCVDRGLKQSKSEQLLTNFDMHTSLRLDESCVLPVKYQKEKNLVRLLGIVPTRDLKAPDETLFVVFKTGALRMDLLNNTVSLVEGRALRLPFNSKSKNINLEIPLNSASGILMHVLQIRYLNRYHFNANNGRSNVMRVLGIDRGYQFR